MNPTPPDISHEQSRLESVFRTELTAPTLGLRLGVDWGQNSHDGRPRIRRAIASELGTTSAIQLDQLPNDPTRSISISHTITMGGFAFVDRPSLIGFDLELETRVSSAIVTRVAQHHELKAAPSAGSLWSAKEAAYKATAAHFELSLISQIRIAQWHRSNSGHSFTAAYQFDETENIHRIQGLGLVIPLDGFVVSVFIAAGSTKVEAQPISLHQQ